MATEKPWKDWPDTDIEAGWYVKNEYIFQGYGTGEFRPNENISLAHFQSVLTRAEIPWSLDDFIPITEDVVRIKTSQKIMPGTAWSAGPEEKVTRFRTAVMIYRYKNNIQPPNQDEEIATKLNKWFDETWVTWDGVSRQTKFANDDFGQLFVDLSEEYNVPIWLALGQCWRESQWFTTGLSVKPAPGYNCGWGMKDSKQRWGEHGNPTHVKGYSNYISVEEAVGAYFRLMDSLIMPYRALIDKYLATGDLTYISQALDIYAPGYENDTIQHHKIVRQVKEWCEQRGIK